MEKSTTQGFRMDMPTAIRLAVATTVILFIIGLVIILLAANDLVNYVNSYQFGYGYSDFGDVGVGSFSIVPLIISLSPLLFLVPGYLGWKYTAAISKKISPTYLEAAVGGGITGGLLLLFLYVAILLLGGIFASFLGTGVGGGVGGVLGLVGFAAIPYLLRSALISALIGAIGGAAFLLFRSAQIK